MFDNLIRRDPRDSGKTIVPIWRITWEIAKDGKTYTFHLREGVQFHDGTDFTSADIKATFDRIAKPPAGVSIPRTPLFRGVSEINARDKYTVEFPDIRLYATGRAVAADHVEELICREMGQLVETDQRDLGTLPAGFGPPTYFGIPSYEPNFAEARNNAVAIGNAMDELRKLDQVEQHDADGECVARFPALVLACVSCR